MKERDTVESKNTRKLIEVSKENMYKCLQEIDSKNSRHYFERLDSISRKVIRKSSYKDIHDTVVFRAKNVFRF